MKKIILTTVSALTSQLFAQDIIPTALPSEIPTMNNALGFDIITTLVAAFFYLALPIILYCISSYSLSLLNKHYNKKATSKISWIPFVRYYDFVKNATRSPKKAFIITLLPWIIAITWVLWVVLVALMAKNMDVTSASWMPSTFITLGVIILIGIIDIIGMNFWRAFIISKFVKWDITTALGLSTYTALVLWYIALDRVKKNTNIIGIIGFIGIGLLVCFYIGVLFVFGFSGLNAFLGL